MELVHDPKLKLAIKTTLSWWQSGTFDVITSLEERLIRDSLTVKTLPITPSYKPCLPRLFSWTKLLMYGDYQ